MNTWHKKLGHVPIMIEFMTEKGTFVFVSFCEHGVMSRVRYGNYLMHLLREKSIGSLILDIM